MALGGTETSELQREAAEMLRRILEVDIVGVLGHDAEANEFEVVVGGSRRR